MSQETLRDLSGVGTTTIKDAEKNAQIPKADTLKLLADGLATYAPGRKDTELAATYYSRLMKAAGYLEDPPGGEAQTAPDPRELVRAFIREAAGEDVAAELLAAHDEGGIGAEGEQTVARLIKTLRENKRLREGR
jgi:hypothetical protein